MAPPEFMILLYVLWFCWACYCALLIVGGIQSRRRK
jgi:hypothetical protein